MTRSPPWASALATGSKLVAPMSSDPPTTPCTTGTPEARFFTFTVRCSARKYPSAWATATSALAKLVTLVGSPRLMTVLAGAVLAAGVLLHPPAAASSAAKKTVLSPAAVDKRRMAGISFGAADGPVLVRPRWPATGPGGARPTRGWR